jgi:Ser/Thr protein kinase RdoA (MazF antagonist)
MAALVSAEVPVVAPLRDNDGESLQRVPEIDILYAVFPKRGGRMMDELDTARLERLGRLIARMHGVGLMEPARHRLRLDATTYGRKNLDYLLSSGALPPELRDRYAQVVAQICDLAEARLSTQTYQRIHGDCHVGNILWGSEGPALVDFDDMVMGPQIQDLWLLIPGRDAEASRKLDALVAGYSQLRDFNRGSLNLIESLRSLRMIHFSAWIARRWSDPIFPRTFTQFGTMGYWKEQLADLQEQLQLIQEGN